MKFLSATGGFGDWQTDGCKIVDLAPGHVTAHCNHLTAFAILEDQSSVHISMFQMMEIVVYVGSCVCLLCLMAVIITYVSCFRWVHWSNEGGHLLMILSVLYKNFTRKAPKKQTTELCLQIFEKLPI